MAIHNEIGTIGEDIASRWLIRKGFAVLERNYRKKWGEIDIISRETNGNVRFIEVKTVSYETREDLDWAVTHETWRPEEKIHRNKQDRLKRAIQTWLLETKYDGKWQIDILVVRLVPREKFGRVKFMENIVFE